MDLEASDRLTCSLMRPERWILEKYSAERKDQSLIGIKYEPSIVPRDGRCVKWSNDSPLF